MDANYLGRISFSRALALEGEALASVFESRGRAVVLGFEAEPVITCGVRAGSEDLMHTPEHLARLGFEICEVERGGQTTIHNPGQLVIFPVIDVRKIGVRAWVCLLARVTGENLVGVWNQNRMARRNPAFTPPGEKSWLAESAFAKASAPMASRSM